MLMVRKHVAMPEDHFLSSLAMLTLSLPNVAKGKLRPNLQISFSKVLRNK